MTGCFEIALSALRWYADQSWDTGEVHYGHGQRARDALEQIVTQASPAFEGEGKDDPGSSGGCVTGRDVGDESA